MMHLPSFSRLSMDALRQADTGTTKRPKGYGPPPIFFKAYLNSPWRKLSNLFGPVEWMYQQTKFKPESAVHQWLQMGLGMERNQQWDGDVGGNFDEARKRFFHDGQLASYVTSDKQVASGLLAQQTSQIAKNPPGSDLARKRLTHIRRAMKEWNLPRYMTQNEMDAWHAENVNGVATAEQTQARMLEFLRVKYKDPKYADRGYADLLLSTGDSAIHELAAGRGRPSLWEYKELTDAQRAAGYVSGGDLLGRLLTQVRAELRAAAEPPTEEDEEDTEPAASRPRRE